MTRLDLSAEWFAKALDAERNHDVAAGVTAAAFRKAVGATPCLTIKRHPKAHGLRRVRRVERSATRSAHGKVCHQV